MCKQVMSKSVSESEMSKLIDLRLLGPSPTAYIHMCKDPRHWQDLWYLRSVILSYDPTMRESASHMSTKLDWFALNYSSIYQKLLRYSMPIT